MAESPGNLEVLCANHHRAHYGIHVIPGPLWEALRFHKTGTGPAAEFIPADGVEAASAGLGDDEKPAAKRAAIKGPDTRAPPDRRFARAALCCNVRAETFRGDVHAPDLVCGRAPAAARGVNDTPVDLAAQLHMR